MPFNKDQFFIEVDRNQKLVLLVASASDLGLAPGEEPHDVIDYEGPIPTIKIKNERGWILNARIDDSVWNRARGTCWRYTASVYDRNGFDCWKYVITIYND